MLFFFQLTNDGWQASIAILGAISAQDTIDIPLRKPIKIADSKKRKTYGTVVTTTIRIGTRTEYFLGYLQNVMDVPYKNDLKRHYIVMDTAPIHKSVTFRKCIKNRGYICIYLPPCSPFLNPIEEFWSNIKFGVEGSFDNGDSRTPRIMEPCTEGSLKDFRGWIRPSVLFFEGCLALEEKL